MSKIEPEAALLDAAAEQGAADAAATRGKRKRLFIALAGTVLSGAAAYGAYAYAVAGHAVSTDNAYVATETAQVTPAIAGIVREVHVTDTQSVKRGDVVVTLDDTDARLALGQAEAELGRAVRRVRGYVANDGSLPAQIASRVSEEQRAAAQVQAAGADFERAQIDLQRRDALAASGSVSGDELTKARNAFDNARAALLAAQAQAGRARADHTAAVGSRNANAVLIVDATEDTNPEVALARAR